MKPHITYFISLSHALKIIKKMQVRKHREAGYSFELEDIENQNKVWNNPDRLFYDDYASTTHIYKLNIYYEKPDESKIR